MWFNAHAGSEGQGLTRSADRSVLTMTGYCDDLGSLTGNTTDTPSSTTNSSARVTIAALGLLMPTRILVCLMRAPIGLGC